MDMHKQTLHNLLNKKWSRELMCDSLTGWDTRNMDDRALRQSIVQDVLGFTMYEIESGKDYDLREPVLLKWVNPSDWLRVKTQLKHPEIAGLIEINSSGAIRIHRNRAVLETAMAYCGVWWGGFMPSDMSGVDITSNPTKPMAMDLQTTHTSITILEDTDTITPEHRDTLMKLKQH